MLNSKCYSNKKYKTIHEKKGMNKYYKKNQTQISVDIVIIFYEILGHVDNVEKVTNKDEENKEKEFNTASLKKCIHVDYEFYSLEKIKENNT